RLQAGTIKFLHRELLRVDPVETANVEHHHIPAARALAVRIRLNPARLAERVMDSAVVELILGYFIFSRQKLEVRHCDAGKQRSEFAAARTVAGDDFADV